MKMDFKQFSVLLLAAMPLMSFAATTIARTPLPSELKQIQATDGVRSNVVIARRGLTLGDVTVMASDPTDPSNNASPYATQIFGIPTDVRRANEDWPNQSGVNAVNALAHTGLPIMTAAVYSYDSQAVLTKAATIATFGNILPNSVSPQQIQKILATDPYLSKKFIIKGNKLQLKSNEPE